MTDLTVLPARDDIGLLADLLIEASKDSALEGTAFPRITDARGVSSWLESVEGGVWMVFIVDEPAGLLLVLPENDEGKREAVMYLLPHYRAHGYSSRFWSLVERDFLPSGTLLYARVKGSNDELMKWLGGSGWVFTGFESYEDAETDVGWAFFERITN